MTYPAPPGEPDAAAPAHEEVSEEEGAPTPEEVVPYLRLFKTNKLASTQGNYLTGITVGTLSRMEALPDHKLADYNSKLSTTSDKPCGITVAGNGTVLVSQGHCIRQVTPILSFTTLAGSMLEAGFADGRGPAAKFKQPKGLAVDASQAVYVADSGNHCIRRIDPDGLVTTLAGNAESAGYADGLGAEAKFRQPMAVALDSMGHLVVADYGNHRIRRVSPEGNVTTVAGSGEPGAVDAQGHYVSLHCSLHYPPMDSINFLVRPSASFDYPLSSIYGNNHSSSLICSLSRPCGKLQLPS